MDAKLVAWGRAVKKRTRARQPVLWLFTDAGRGTDPVAAAGRLPKGISGVVFRHDGVGGRAALARAMALVCRARRLAMVVAGDGRLAAALGVGVHLRGGRWPDSVRRKGLKRGAVVSSSAHGPQQLHRARRAGAEVVFLSPAFPTASHPGAPGLGPNRWGGMARMGRGGAILALGGVNGVSIRRLPLGYCAGVGAIGALGG
jgi:thiamine-phosphate pyrophosphorylase